MSSFDNLPGTVIADFANAALPAARLSHGISRRQWELIAYTTVAGDGTMLCARSHTTPEPVTVDPGLSGWHRIYLCIFAGDRECRLSLRLDGDRAPAYFTQGDVRNGCWSLYEHCEESFWKCADLTGRKLTVGKPAGAAAAMVGLMWLRFEPMSAAEVRFHQADAARRDTRRLHAHSDMEWLSMVHPAGMDDYCSMIEEYAASDVESASVEVFTTLGDFQWVEDELKSGNGDLYDFRMASQVALAGCRKEVYGEYLRRAGEYGIKLYASHRMALSNFTVPYSTGPCSVLPFVGENPQWYCRDRDGEVVGFLSYAFREVREFMIARFMEMIELGFHGAELILHRGIELMFEKPVLERFQDLYPGIDPRRLSLDDPRLAGVRCGFVTEFVRSLRRAFDDYSAAHGRPRLAIHPVVNYGIADNLRLGLDVAAWAAEGLIDGMTIGQMRIWEEEELFRDDRNPELLSLEKYAEVKRHGAKSPISREHYNALDLLVAHCPDYMEIAHRHGVKVYFEMPWENTCPPEELRDYAMRLYEAGAENLAVWDCYVGRVIYRPEWQITSKLGHKDELAGMPGENSAYRRLYRITGLGGKSLAGYNPNWRG